MSDPVLLSHEPNKDIKDILKSIQILEQNMNLQQQISHYINYG